MMEENRKGPGIFYAVTGVATLVVAIIGATFAYFSATAESTGDTITGDTLNIAGGVLSVTVDRVEFDAVTATSDDLVPAYFSETYNPDEMTTAQIGNMLTAKCENQGYTGCHVWKVDATTTQSITNANLLLDLTAPKNNEEWSYAVFKAGTLNTNGTASTGLALPTVDNTAVTTALGDGKAVGSFGAGITDLDIHNNAALTVPEDEGSYTETYYLLIYLNDNNEKQNEGTHDATGTYNGNVELQALGGKVRASFAG